MYPRHTHKAIRKQHDNLDGYQRGTLKLHALTITCDSTYILRRPRTSTSFEIKHDGYEKHLLFPRLETKSDGGVGFILTAWDSPWRRGIDLTAARDLDDLGIDGGEGFMWTWTTWEWRRRGTWTGPGTWRRRGTSRDSTTTPKLNIKLHTQIPRDHSYDANLRKRIQIINSNIEKV